LLLTSSEQEEFGILSFMHILKCTKINGELCSCAFKLFDMPILPHFLTPQAGH